MAKKSGQSLLQRAAAKKRTKAAADTMAPTKVPPSKDAHRDTEIIFVKKGEHGADAFHRDRMRRPESKGTTVKTPIDDERSQFLKGPLSEMHIDMVCRCLRFPLHRETTERLLGLSKGRIKTWIRRGKVSRDKIEAWHDEHDNLVQDDGLTSDKAVAKIGPQPEFDIFATFHACVLVAEGLGEKTAIGWIVDAATMGVDPDWRAGAWLLSRKYAKRWGSYAERQMSDEEDQVHGDEKQKLSAVDRLAGVLEDMFGKEKDTDDV